MRKQLFISTVEPFTLLKLCQLLREIPSGDALELLVEGDRIPDELFKIIPPERYQIVTQTSGTGPEHIQVVIHRRIPPLPGTPPTSSNGGCCR